MTHALAAGRGPRRRSQAGGQPPGVADAAGQPAVPAQPHEGSLGALPLLSVLAGGPSRACFFRGLDPGCRAMFLWPRRGFPIPAVGSLSIFAIETLLALHGAELPSWWELEIIAKPLRLLHESLLSGRSFLTPCAQKLATTLCPCSLSPAVCQFVLVAARRFLQSVTYFVGRSARAPSRRFAFAAFDLLICAGVEAGPW